MNLIGYFCNRVKLKNEKMNKLQQAVQDSALISLIDAKIEQLDKKIGKAERIRAISSLKSQRIDAIEIIETFAPKLIPLHEKREHILNDSEYLNDIMKGGK